ncbi:MAG: sugar transferase [Oscillospiraceae bacterium]|jgi:exopolysaccharide biosynthesis polyprenyl glycosylphosphotransferase|nr:sugar transferase [Oscillospiraceae bacterium]
MTGKTGSVWLFLAKAALFVVVLGVFFVGQVVFYGQTLFYFWGNNIILLLYAATLYFTCRIYRGLHFGSIDLYEIVLSWILCLIVTNILEYLQLSLLENKLLPPAGFLIVLAAQLVLVIPLAFFIDKLYYHLNPAHKAIIIYSREEKVREYREIIERRSRKFRISDIVSQDEPLETLMNRIGESESVFFLNVDEIRRGRLLEYCFMHDKRAYILPTFSGVLLNTAEISWISNTPMFLPKSPEMEPVARLIKRTMDIVLSIFAIILLSWLMLIVLAAIRFYDHYPAIFKQTRITKGGKLFTLYKFRSMRPDAEDDEIPRLAAKDDKRITPVGRIIRKTRIDELPQFFNVLSGTMSLVGPRPERPEIAKQYEEMFPNFSFRTKVKAGMTGFAQIYGRYNTAPDEKLFLDIFYIEKFSIWQDVRLLLQTIKVVFMPSSAEGFSMDDDG